MISDESVSTVAAPGADAAGGPALLRPLRLRDFRLLFSGETVSLLGDQFHFVALAWLTLQLTGSGLALGTVLTTAAVPRAVFMLAGGALSDRFSPRSLMLASNVLRGIVVGVLAALVLGGNAQLWQLYVMAAIFGAVDAIFHPALNTMVPMLVPERQLSPANALVQGSQQLTTLIGPAVAGLVVAALQTGPAFVVDAISFGVAAMALSLVRGGRRAASHSSHATGETPPTSFLSTIGEGIAYAWRDPAVRSLILLTAVFNLAFTGPLVVGVPVLADTRFHGGSAALGFILSGFGGGAVVGAVLAGSLASVPRLGAVVLGVAVLLGLGLAALGFAPNVVVAVAIALLMGVGIGFINVRSIAWLQARTPEALRGRVMSLLLLGAMSLAPISYALAGVIIDLGAVEPMYLVAAALVVAAATAGFAFGLPARMTDEVAA